MNNFDYQMFLNGTTNDGFADMFLQNNNSSMPPLFNNGMNYHPRTHEATK